MRLLEEELERLDAQEVATDDELLMNRQDIDAPDFAQRKALMKAIEEKFCEYSDLLASAQALAAFNKPTTGEHRSVQNWIHNVQPVDEADSSFVNQTEDLVTLRPGREHAWLDAAVEKMLRWCNCSLVEHLFRSNETRLKTDGTGKEVYYTRERIERFVVGIIVVMILVLLIVPIWLLYHLTQGLETARSNAICIGILLIFTLLFSACISLFTRARRHEILAAAAGYCAVLVVFLGNVGSNNHGGILGNTAAMLMGS